MSKDIAKISLGINAIKLNPEDPFAWTSGFRMPIYNDNRLFLFHPESRNLLAKEFKSILTEEKISYDIIAGTSTAGISPATTLADLLQKPMIYVRSETKKYGLNNKIEGKSDLSSYNIVLIEDLISTGKSSANAVQAIRDAGGECNYCLSIFNYDLDKSVQTFNNFNPKCEVRSILNYKTLLEVAKEEGYINEDHVKVLEDWRSDPFGWGDKYGFPKLENN